VLTPKVCEMKRGSCHGASAAGVPLDRDGAAPGMGAEPIRLWDAGRASERLPASWLSFSTQKLSRAA
jgi:hypothetical protein